ncbi:hypothetical protein AURDEDRAFT_169758 [Auricularia subglabra TFB-10046 SS5]|nr:hypothetical protein AURDEDRAFT_169758 [Auricularia subglabra TFB-10046 SS5]
MKSRASLQVAITEARKAVKYTLLIPNEIVSLVFAHAAAWKRGAGDPIDWTAVTLPWCLRLVCKRWNAIALSTQALWTYIAVPVTVEFVARTGLPEYLALQLDRSGSMALKVVVDAEFSCDADLTDSARDALIRQQTEALRNLFDVLVTEPIVARISILEVYGGPPTPSQFLGHHNDRDSIRSLTLGMLRLPTPSLEEAVLQMDPDDYGQDEPWQTSPLGPLPLYLPVAPKLRMLRMVRFPLLCYPAHPGFPSLEFLTYDYNFAHESHLLGMLALCPVLRELDTSLAECDNTSIPAFVTDPITLPVRSLIFGEGELSAAFADRVRLPNVTALQAIPHTMFSHDLHQRLASTLTSITFTGFSLREDDVDLLVGLTRIEDATFEVRHFPAHRLVEYLCRDDPLWPRLKRLVVDTLLQTDDGDALVQLARHIKAREADAGTASQFESLSVRKVEVANWVLAQLRASLGSDRVHIL